MKDIPIFTSEYGVASLTLKEIPYTKRAYIRLQDSIEPRKLLDECRAFCLAAGAESVFAAGDPCLNAYPEHTLVLRMKCLRNCLGDTDARLVPVKADTLSTFCRIYNDAMQNVANASYLAEGDARRLLTKNNSYFIYRENKVVGIGIASDETIQAVAAVIPGCGKDVVLALNRVLTGPEVQVDVASVNKRAVHLYEKLGFKETQVLSVWYTVT